MSEPLDLAAIKKRRASSTYYCAMADVPLSEAESDRVELLAEVERLRSELATLQVLADSALGYLLAEVERLRGEVARQAEQITAVRALTKHSWLSNGDVLEALDGAS